MIKLRAQIGYDFPNGFSLLAGEHSYESIPAACEKRLEELKAKLHDGKPIVEVVEFVEEKKPEPPKEQKAPEPSAPAPAPAPEERQTRARAGRQAPVTPPQPAAKPDDDAG